MMKLARIPGPVWAVVAAAAMLSAGAAPSGGQDGDWLPPALVATRSAKTERLGVEALVSHRTARPGDTLHAAVELKIAPAFWLYGPVPGGRLVQPRPLVVKPVDWPLPPGQVLYPPAHPHASDIGGQIETNNVYEGTVYAYIPITVPADAKAGRYDLPVRVQGQVCDPNTCLLPEVTVKATVEVGPAAAPSPDWTGPAGEGLAHAKTLQQWREILARIPALSSPTGAPVSGSAVSQLAVWTALPLAFLAGLILNIMPCVLPVIPLKVLSIVGQARQSPRRFALLGLTFAGGIILFFVALAALNAVLVTLFHYTFQWGDHFRQPAFVIAMTLLLVALAANMLGAFAVLAPARLAGAGPREGYAGALGMGLLTAVLSTPCSFGILTAAFAWAQLQPLWLGTIGILTIGLGMAAPYAVLTAFPKLASRLPRAGRWSELFKQSMGFVLLLVAVWLLSTRAGEAAQVFWVAAYGVVLAFCLWMWGSWIRYDAPPARKWGVRAAAAACAVAAGWWMLSPSRPLAVRFEPFDAAQIASARAAGRPVLIDFTAAWCLTCKTVEWRVYNDSEVARALADRNVLAVKGDVTTNDLPAVAMLKDLGEPGVPVSVLFAPGKTPPIRLHGVFSKAQLLRALEGMPTSR